MMQSDKPQGTLMIQVGTQGICIFAWDGISENELEDALEATRDFMGSKALNPFTMGGKRTGKRITVQPIHWKATLNPGGQKLRKTQKNHPPLEL